MRDLDPLPKLAVLEGLRWHLARREKSCRRLMRDRIAQLLNESRPHFLDPVEGVRVDFLRICILLVIKQIQYRGISGPETELSINRRKLLADERDALQRERHDRAHPIDWESG